MSLPFPDRRRNGPFPTAVDSPFPAFLDEPRDACLRLSAEFEHRGRSTRLRARGEVDAFTMPRWRRMLDHGADTVVPGGQFVVDLRGLGFVSCRGFGELVRTATRCRAHGCSLFVVEDGGWSRRVLEVVDPAGELVTYPHQVHHPVGAEPVATEEPA
ncbi:hypothetical protein ATM97_14320 [Nocardia sp. MH4]|uniref:STAS domain-containing protein n=1 Tax=Nocardia sp. MH4 TaxID=1768677 RepID=UPI001C4FCA4C|nr:STAS domain-containing protein [Nocardia sp. MH4]MBW0271776.1 hypothetical protein [Nocardia sp. MH4]